MYIFMLYHDDDSYSNYNLNGQPYDTYKQGEKSYFISFSKRRGALELE